MPSAVITLLTDFGLQDEYVGVMKGVIMTIAGPGISIVDLNHGIAAQDVRQAAFLLDASYRYFPPGSIHLVVVDPGVGTQRRLIGLKLDRHYFIGPDNGLFSCVMKGASAAVAVELNNQQCWLKTTSDTFHGRDILAPVAAHLAAGMSLDALGTALDPSSICLPADWQPRLLEPHHLQGTIIAVDRFGNLITNVHSSLLPTGGVDELPPAVRIDLANGFDLNLQRQYAGVERGEPLALINSRGFLEIAVNQGDARRFFDAAKGDTVEIYW
jgi:S-adenosylmethionine hydrolase